MMLSSVSLLTYFLLVIVNLSSYTDGATLNSNNSVEAVPYDIIAIKPGFEIRKYPARKWAATSLIGTTDREDATITMFKKLYFYISGANTQNVQIPMTKPVTVYLQPGIGPNSENTWTEAFYVPNSFQANPPTGNEIFIEERPEMIVYAKRFGGYANDNIIVTELTELAESIQSANETGVDFTNYYFAGYDSPFKPVNRRNEVWYIKRS